LSTIVAARAPALTQVNAGGQWYSPIIDEGDFGPDEAPPGMETEAPVCHFNGESFALGSYVRSGSDLLKCERGVWVRMGEQRPD
jgi:hypothetical protein